MTHLPVSIDGVFLQVEDVLGCPPCLFPGHPTLVDLHSKGKSHPIKGIFDGGRSPIKSNTNLPHVDEDQNKPPIPRRGVKENPAQDGFHGPRNIASEVRMRSTKMRAARIRVHPTRACASKKDSSPRPRSRTPRAKELRSLCELLMQVEGVAARKKVLEKHSKSLQEYLQTWRGSRMLEWMDSKLLDEEKTYLLCSVGAAGQHHVLDVLVDVVDTISADDWEEVERRWEPCLHMLRGVEKFYDCFGGIVGYQWKVMHILDEGEEGPTPSMQNSAGGLVSSKYAVPEGLDLECDLEAAREAAADGIRALHAMAELYPLGGAGDRLGLRDEVGGEPLPVACLPYLGRSLLACLMRDVQARDYLHYCVFGTPARPPVAVMTSEAKGNATRIKAMFEANAWFGLGEENVMLFKQPMVPMVEDGTGLWIHEDMRKGAAVTPMSRPGGHGAIWKLLLDQGVAQWLKLKGRKAVITRQISNPLAGVDTTLLALAGHGYFRGKAFGFMSCERRVGSAEGVNVVATHRTEDGRVKTGISNIEYTEFSRLGIMDAPRHPETSISLFPCNTNVLYVDLEAAESAVRSGEGALPGMILNLKKKVPVFAEDGRERYVRAGRLECTMQNLADSLANTYVSEDDIPEQADLDSFLMFNARRRVTSSAKKRRKPAAVVKGEDLHQTPDGSFLDLQRNAAELLQSCEVNVPDVVPEGGVVEYLKKGPQFSFVYHPALGPVWDVIQQKIHGGSLATGSEVELEISELQWEHVNVNGSLLIEARYPVGSPRKESSLEGVTRFAAGYLSSSIQSGEEEPVPPIEFGKDMGRVRLQNVVVQNRGVDREDPGNIQWQRKVNRKEACHILLGAGAEFAAKDVCIKGDQEFLVPDYCRMVVAPDGEGGVTVDVHKLQGRNATWKWNYMLREKGFIELEMVEAGIQTHFTDAFL